MRCSPKPEAPVPMRRAVTAWVLVQTAPTIEVLATAATKERLATEAAEMIRICGERSDHRTFAYLIKPANHLFG